MARAAALLAAAVITAHSAVFLAGRSLMPIAPSLTTVPGMPYGYAGPVPDVTTSIDPTAALNIDYANDLLTSAHLSRGSMPFWNRHQGFGAPFLASGHPGVLYPLAPLLAVLPRDSYEFVYLLSWYVAALFTYLYLRVIDVGTVGAVLGAVAVVASGFGQHYLVIRDASATAAWFPALLYAIERTVREPAWRARHVVIALACYATITAGQPESTAVALTAATVYGLASAAWRRAGIRTVLAFAPGVVCGALLTAPFWWSFADYAFTAYSHHDAQSIASTRTLGWRTIAAYVTPHLYGRPHTLPPWMVPDGWSWDLTPGWLTAATAFGVVFGVWRAIASRERPLILLLAMGAAAAGKIWGIPPFTLIASLPLFDRIVYPRYAAFILAFAAAMLAGAGWEFALTRPARQWRLAAAIWIGAAAGLYLLSGVWWQPVFTAIQVRAFSVLAWCWIAGVPAALCWLRARDRADDRSIAAVIGASMIVQLVAYQPGYPPATYAVLTIAGLLAWILLTLLTGGLSRPSPTATLTVAALVCAAPELVLALSDSRGLARRYDPATPPPYAAMLRTLQSATGGRAYAIDGIPHVNFATPLTLEMLNKCDGLDPRGAALYLRRLLDPGADPVCFSGSVGRYGPRTAIEEFHDRRRFFNLGAIRYLVTKTTPIRPSGDDRRMRLAGVDGATGVQIWEDLDAFPRAFLACPAVRAASIDEALAALHQIGDPRHNIVVEPDAPNPCAPGLAPPSGELETMAARDNGWTLRYRADGPGILVIVDAFERGWSVRVDGAPRPVIRVDGAFIGVPLLRAGVQTVEGTYAPPHWRASMLSAGTGAIGLAGVTALARRRPRKGDAD